MKIAGMSISDTLSSRFKKILIEFSSLKTWGIFFLGYLNYHLIVVENKVDVFLITSFLVGIGIREASDLAQQKIQNGGGKPPEPPKV